MTNTNEDHINYTCKLCNYVTHRNSNYKRHLLTKRHLALVNKKIIDNSPLYDADHTTYLSDDISDEPNPSTQYVCLCGKNYMSKSGLWKHRKKCSLCKDIQEKSSDIVSDSDNPNISDNLSGWMKQMTTLVTEAMVTVASRPNTIINQQNTFNIDTFLNVQCKDALNMSDFIEQLNITYDDLVYVGKNGFVKGAHKTFVEKIEQMDETKRPLHCSDKKRKIVYIKEDDVWEKDNDHSKIYNTIKAYSKKMDQTMMEEFENKPQGYFTDEWNQDRKREIMSAVTDYNWNTYDSINKKLTNNIANACYIDKKAIRKTTNDENITTLMDSEKDED